MSANQRWRRGGGKRNRLRRQTVRLEPLEPRIALDGSDELGIIAPNEGVVIDFPYEQVSSFDRDRVVRAPGRFAGAVIAADANELLQINHHWAVGDASAESLRSPSTIPVTSVPLLPTPPTVGDVAYFNLQVVDSSGSTVEPSGDHFLGRAGDVASTPLFTFDLLSVTRQLEARSTTHDVTPASSQWETIETHAANSIEDLDAKDDFGTGVFGTGLNHVVSGKATKVAESFELTAENPTTGALTLNSSDRQAGFAGVPLDDPAVILPPQPAAGFLPIESIANLRAVQTPELPGGQKTAKLGTRSSSEQSADGAEETSAVALSRDRYFASDEGRDRVAWSANSAASESRQHVSQTPQGQPLAVHRHRQPSHWFADSRGGVSVVPRAVDDVLVAVTATSLSQATDGDESLGQTLVSTAVLPVLTNDGAPPSSRLTDAGWEAAGHPLTELSDSPVNAVIRDLLFAHYDPLLVLVGVSLVSAHVIADSKTGRETRSPRLRSHLSRRGVSAR